MKKISKILVLTLLLVMISNVSYAEQFSYKYISIGKGALTNLDPEDNKLHIIISALILTSSSTDSDKDDIPVYELSIPNIPGIDYNDYELVDSYPYNPNSLDLEKDKNIWRVVSPQIKDQGDFDKFMYRPDGIEYGQDFSISDGSLKGGFGYSLDKTMANLHLSKYLKLPGAIDSLADLYQWNESQKKEYSSYFNTAWYEDNYVDKHLFSYSIVVELEKKIEEPVMTANDPLGYGGVWKSSADTKDYFTLIIEPSAKYKDKYLVGLNSQAGMEVGITSLGYIDIKEGKQYLSKVHDWAFYEGEPYPTFYIELKDGKANIITDNPFSKMFGSKVTFDLLNKNPGVWAEFEKSDGDFIQYFE